MTLPKTCLLLGSHHGFPLSGLRSSAVTVPQACCASSTLLSIRTQVLFLVCFPPRARPWRGPWKSWRIELCCLLSARVSLSCLHSVCPQLCQRRAGASCPLSFDLRRSICPPSLSIVETEEPSSLVTLGTTGGRSLHSSLLLRRLMRWSKLGLGCTPFSPTAGGSRTSLRAGPGQDRAPATGSACTPALPVAELPLQP